MRKRIKFIAFSGLIAAIYFVSSMAMNVVNLTYGQLQFRISEALTLLPIIMPEAIPGLIIGCLATNAFSPFFALDMTIGTVATGIASLLTYLLRKRIFLASLPPIILNALLVPTIFLLTGEKITYWIVFMEIFISQSLIIWFIGIPLVGSLKKSLINLNLINIDIRDEFCKLSKRKKFLTEISKTFD